MRVDSRLLRTARVMWRHATLGIAHQEHMVWVHHLGIITVEWGLLTDLAPLSTWVIIMAPLLCT